MLQRVSAPVGRRREATKLRGVMPGRALEARAK
jgi:hypothetical protein